MVACTPTLSATDLVQLLSVARGLHEGSVSSLCWAVLFFRRCASGNGDERLSWVGGVCLSSLGSAPPFLLSIVGAAPAWVPHLSLPLAPVDVALTVTGSVGHGCHLFRGTKVPLDFLDHRLTMLSALTVVVF